MRGHVYILVNPAFHPNYIKIGRTEKTPEERAEELSKSTSVPVPFEVAHSKLFNNCVDIERIVHKKFEKKRVRQEREFFNMEIHDAVKYIDDLYEKLPEFFFDFVLIDTLFRLRNKATVYFFSRYNEFTTNCILTRLGVNGLFDGVITPKIYNENELRDQMSLKGKEQAKKFSWEKTVFETYNVYKEILDLL